MKLKRIIKVVSKRKFIIHIIVIIFFYLTIRLPLINKPLLHDEVGNTFIYLNTSPLSQLHSQENINLEARYKSGLSWGTDWDRLIAIHPPFLSTFYYFWVRLFGDSEVSLHTPTIIFGVGAIVLLYFVGSLLFGSDLSFLATLATSFSISHIMHSMQAVDAIFESFILLASLLYLCKFIITGNKGIFLRLLILNVIGLLIFYHYFAYLLIQTIVLWFYRNKFEIPRSYFLSVSVLMLIFLASVITVFLVIGYSFEFWMQPNFVRLLEAMVSLPYYNIQMTKTNPALYCKIGLFLLFLLGCSRIFFSYKRSINSRNLLKLILVAIFIFPFMLYLTIGASGIRFGHARNFFYLLPIYFLGIFYGLEKLSYSKKLFYSFASIIFIFLLLGGLPPKYLCWKELYIERVRIKYAAELDVDSVLIPNKQITTRQFQYYVKRYNIANKVYRPFGANNRSKNLKRLAIIKNGGDGSISKSNRYFISQNLFTIDKVIRHQGYYGPFQSLQRLIQRPSLITIYLLKNGS